MIGGGFAGLSAAVRLADRGVRVLVLEKRSRLGGRATAFRDRETGVHVDNGQHVLAGCYRQTFAFLETIGAAGLVTRPPGLATTMVERGGLVSRLVCPGGSGSDAWVSWPSPLHLLVGILSWSALSWRDRLSIVRMARPLLQARRALASQRPSSSAADAMSTVTKGGETVDAWLARHGQSPRLRHLLWDPLALAALNQPPEVAAASYFARVLAEMFGPNPTDASIALPTVALDALYAEPARAFLESRGGDVYLGADASVGIARDGVTVRATRVGTVAQAWRPRAVIAAVPWFALPALFVGDAMALEPTLAAARATEPSPIVTVNLWFDRPILGESYVGLPGRRMQWVFEFRGEGDQRAVTRVSLVSSGAADVLEMTNPALMALAHQELRDALPTCRAATLVRGGVIREPRATFSLAPGQPPRPETRTLVPGLYLAGDWIATGLPATIESAVRSGHMAADAVMSHVPRILRPRLEP